MVLDLIDCWKLMAEVAWPEGEPDPVVHALALSWSQEMFRGSGETFSFGLSGLFWGWLAALKKLLTRAKPETAARSRERFDLLLLPVFGPNYYTGPCIAAGAAIQRQHPELAVGLLKPLFYKGRSFGDYARAQGYTGAVLDWRWEIPVFPLRQLLRSLARMRRLSALEKPPEFKQFFRARRRKKFLEIFSAEIVMSDFERQLRAWGVQDVITMNEQHFPSNLLVAAANAVGARTHEILHGGIAWRVYVPFACRFLWTEYEVTARNLASFGGSPSRFRVVPGLQVAAALGASGNGHVQRRARGPRRRLLLLAQWHGFPTRWQPAENALLVTMRALAERKEAWEFVVRPHPGDSADDLLDMHSIIQKSGLDVLVADGRMDLAVEAAKADLVVSAASTGVFTAIGAGTPACLVWNRELDETFGEPPLARHWVVHSPEELLPVLDRISRDESRDAASWAAEQAAALGISRVDDAPARFARAFFETVDGAGAKIN